MVFPLIESQSMLLLEFNSLPQILQANTLPLCCQILCLPSICKDLKALSQTLQGWTIILSCALSRQPDSIQQHNFPHKPTLHTCRSSCQQMSTPNHLLLRADPRLEDDVADDKAYSFECLQLNQISVLQYFLEMASSMDYQYVFRQAVFLKEVLARVVTLFWQTGKGGEWQVNWCLRRPQEFMMLGLSLQFGCLTSSWWKEPWSSCCRWRRQVEKGTKGNFTNMPSSTTRLSSNIPYILFPSIFYSSSR